MHCTFSNGKDLIEAIILTVKENELTDGYDLSVVGLDENNNYTNTGKLVLSDAEIEELCTTAKVSSASQLTGRRIRIASNKACKEAGINNLDLFLTNENWNTLEAYRERIKAEKKEKFEKMLGEAEEIDVDIDDAD